MVSILVSSAVDGGSDKAKDSSRWWVVKLKTTFIWYLLLLPKNAVLRRKSKDLLAWNLDIVSKWNDMSTCGLLFQ